MNIQIRKYERPDYDGLIGLLASEYQSTIDQQTLETHYTGGRRRIIVATGDGAPDILGCAFTEIREDYVRPGRVLYVTYVAVHRGYRRHGIGRLLLDEAERLCKENRCAAVELTSADHRTGAHQFYASLGFSKKKTTVFIKEI